MTESPIRAPANLDALIRLVNLLPKSLSSRAQPGVHELMMRPWNDNGDEEAIRSWFYFWRYVNPLPIGLQAFILHDNEARLDETDHGAVSCLDPQHDQPYTNIRFLTKSDDELKDVVLKAKERIEREIEIVQERLGILQRNDSVVPSSPSHPPIAPAWPKEYFVGKLRFSEIGPGPLITRARQRFFFVLGADEILDALTDEDPQERLDTLWYLGESGGLMGHLFIEKGRVDFLPSVLISLVVGAEVSRIKKCKICESYFWAGRRNKKACSLQCGATSRKREERKRYVALKLGDRIPERRNLKSLTSQASSKLDRKGASKRGK